MHTVHSQETKERAIQLRRKGLSTKRISQECGVSMTALKGWFTKIGLANMRISNGGKSYSSEEQRMILSEYAACKSPKSISEKYGICKSTLFYWKQIHKTAAIARTGRIYTAKEVVKLQRRLAKAEELQNILKYCTCSLLSPIEERVREVNRLQTQFSIYALCNALRLSRATYYRVSLQLASNHKTQLKNTMRN